MTTTMDRVLAPDDPLHGTRQAYTLHRCRCAPCTQANAKYITNWRAGVEIVIHHYKGPPLGEWTKRAACVGLTNLMVPVADVRIERKGYAADDIAAAKAVCDTCPVITQCREVGMSDPGIVGVWGGLSDLDRLEIRMGRKEMP